MNKKLVAFFGVIANIFLAFGKIFIGWLSSSSAVLADGINSATDVIASIIGLIGIKAAEKPADEKHPYGHGKAEVISGFLITLIIFVSGILILIEAFKSFINPEITNLSFLAISIMGISAAINLGMSFFKIHYGKKTDSVSLISDGVHSRIDFLVSLTVFIGLFFIEYFSKLDALLAFFVGIYILKESIGLGRETIDSLLGTKADEKTEEQIKEIIKKDNFETILLKTQKLGDKIFAEIEVEMPSKIRLEKANEVLDKLKKELIENIKNLEYVALSSKSRNISSSYIKSNFGKGIGWKRKEKLKKGEKINEKGPGGYCICENCNYKLKHKKGKPCNKIKCPKCKGNMKRED